MIIYDRKIKKVHLELSSNCNLACPQCPRTDGDQPNKNLVLGELTLSKVQELLPPNQLITLDHVYACGNYGDPLMAKDVIPIMQYLRTSSRRLLLGIHTNGSLRNESFYTSLARTMGPNSYVVFAIDGLEDTNHIYRRGAQWRKLMANVKAYIKAGGQAQWHYLVFEHNKHQVEEAKQLAKDLGFVKFTTKKTLRPVHDSTPWLKKVTEPFKGTSKVRCESAEMKEIYISATGVIAPCCYIGGYEQRVSPKQYLMDLSNARLNMTPFKPNLPICMRSCSVSDEGKTFSRTEYVEEEDF